VAAIDALDASASAWVVVNVASTPVLAAVRRVSTDAAEVVTTVAEVTADRFVDAVVLTFAVV
jgi:hypothetical protein